MTRRALRLVVAMVMVLALAGCNESSAPAAARDIARVAGAPLDDVLRAFAADAKVAGSSAEHVATSWQTQWLPRWQHYQQGYRSLPPAAVGAGCDFVTSLYGIMVIKGPDAVTWSTADQAALAAALGGNTTAAWASLGADVNEAMTRAKGGKPDATELLLIKLALCGLPGGR